MPAIEVEADGRETQPASRACGISVANVSFQTGIEALPSLGNLTGYFGASIIFLFSSAYFVGGIDAPTLQVLLV
jgi:hypothetical protein